MPVNKLGTASVSVEADTTGFGKGLPAKLKAALSGTEREAKRAGRRIGREIIDGIGEEIIRKTPALRAKINAMLRGIKVTAKVNVDVDVSTDNDRASKLAERLKGKIEGQITGSLKSASNGIQGIFGRLMPKSVQTAALVVSLASIIGTVLAGATNALGRELLNVVKLSGFLPSILAAAAITAVTLKVGLLGVSDALQAVFSRDPEKLDEALKKLTPSARAFVLEVNKALPVFDRIKAVTQEAMFRPLNGLVTNIINNLGPTVTAGMERVATSLGNMVATVGMLFTDPKMKPLIDSIFRGAADLLDKLGGPLSRVLESLLLAAGAAMPSLGKLGDTVGGLLDKFATWLNNAIADGRFQGWLDSALRTFNDVLNVVKELAKLFGVLFDDANKEGKSFLEIIADMIRDFREFVQSREGQYAFEGIATAAKIAGAILIGIIAIFGVMVAAVGSFVNAVASAVSWLDRLLNRIPGLNALSGFSIGSGTSVNRFNPGHRASGGIIERPELSTLGEDGREVVIPLTRPGRARQLAEQSGLTRMLPDAGTRIVSQKFYLGEEEVRARMVETVERTVNGAVMDATYGTRSAA